MSHRLLHRLLLVGTICFWIICVILTHLPVPPGFIPAAEHDKVRHFVGFAMLATLFCLTLLTSRRSRPPWRTALLVLIILMLYAVLDEITQPPFGRTCDFWDWVADSSGAGSALAAALLAVTVRRTIETNGSANA